MAVCATIGFYAIKLFHSQPMASSQKLPAISPNKAICGILSKSHLNSSNLKPLETQISAALARRVR
jgi:hypothetical protein